MNIETCLANRVALAPYLDPKRFHWVFFVDSFLFPLDNHEQAARSGDMGVYVPLQEKVLQRYMKQEAVNGLPADLAGYEQFVRGTLTDNQKKGGVAMKFEAAYFVRSTSPIRRARRRKRFTPSFTQAACPRRRNTACFRITSSAC